MFSVAQKTLIRHLCLSRAVWNINITIIHFGLHELLFNDIKFLKNNLKSQNIRARSHLGLMIKMCVIFHIARILR